MRPDLQQAFSERVTDASYDRFTRELDTWMGFPIEYRVCEMPIFTSHLLRQKLEEATISILQQCCTEEARQRTASTIPKDCTVPHEPDRPLFAVVDFAICEDEAGDYVPRLIELQGFPSLYGYQYVFASRIRDQYGLYDTTPFFGGLDDKHYLRMLRSAIYADVDPHECALLEVDPDHQKTRPDFRAMERLIGLPTVDIRSVEKRGNKLFAQIEGKDVRLRRVFNRAIVDELEQSGTQLPFSWTDELDIEWAGHPNWYFRISKAVLPWLQHSTVPRTTLLHEIGDLPHHLERFVLKPLYSFAGQGVVVAPTEADIAAIPEHQRSNWILQERVDYASCVPTPFGSNRVEIRVMTIWPDDEPAPHCVMSLARTGRGKLMGARYNTEPWTGSSGCLFV